MIGIWVEIQSIGFFLDLQHVLTIRRIVKKKKSLFPNKDFPIELTETPNGMFTSCFPVLGTQTWNMKTPGGQVLFEWFLSSE